MLEFGKGIDDGRRGVAGGGFCFAAAGDLVWDRARVGRRFDDGAYGDSVRWWIVDALLPLRHATQLGVDFVAGARHFSCGVGRFGQERLLRLRLRLRIAAFYGFGTRTGTVSHETTPLALGG